MDRYVYGDAPSCAADVMTDIVRDASGPVPPENEPTDIVPPKARFTMTVTVREIRRGTILPDPEDGEDAADAL